MLFRYPSVFPPVSLLLVSLLSDVFSDLPQTLPPRLWQPIFTAVLMTFQNSLRVTSIHFVQHNTFIKRIYNYSNTFVSLLSAPWRVSCYREKISRISWHVDNSSSRRVKSRPVGTSRPSFPLSKRTYVSFKRRPYRRRNFSRRKLLPLRGTTKKSLRLNHLEESSDCLTPISSLHPRDSSIDSLTFIRKNALSTS